ncbi:histone-lysine N-methyltransferase SETMAR [Plakobranchus ocellatus]|uniref:Histone-lysine N-methyltransferase SETMAR n=1 Tax=Plakobranchus ocellatus TaxID=259542 RepID=A0AAV4D754_9GAST|nr:histone-lysine N-methyltransferase SETMAR [Plakobranchus ocellatus]
MFPWDDRGDGRPTDTTLLNTLAPVLVAHELLTHDIIYSIQQLKSQSDTPEHLAVLVQQAKFQRLARSFSPAPEARVFIPKLDTLLPSFSLTILHLTCSLTVFWDAKGVILLDILPQGQCINAARYCSTFDRLKEAIRLKRPGLLRRGVVHQHDNATPHSANRTQQWLQRYGWEILPHPAHSPDLAPSDFNLLGPLKRHLGGMAFETEDDLISELRNWFDNLDVDFFRVGINSLLSC